MSISLPGFQFQPAAQRRAFLKAALSGSALAAASVPAHAKGLAFEKLKSDSGLAPEHIRYDHLSFGDPAEKMRAKVKLEFGTADGTYLWWYTFTLFAVTQTRSPVRLLRFEGIEMSEWRRTNIDEYTVHGHNVSFPQDYETGKYLSEWENPLTGKTVKTEPTLLTSDPGRRKTPKGDYDLSDKTQTLRPGNAIFRAEGDLIHKDDVRNPPEDWPGQFVETNTVTGKLEDLLNPTVSSVPARGSGMWIQPFLKWMGMEKGAGHMVGYFNGRKMPSKESLPKPFYDRLMGEHKELSFVDPTKFTGEYWQNNKSGLLNIDQ